MWWLPQIPFCLRRNPLPRAIPWEPTPSSITHWQDLFLALLVSPGTSKPTVICLYLCYVQADVMFLDDISKKLNKKDCSCKTVSVSLFCPESSTTSKLCSHTPKTFVFSETFGSIFQQDKRKKWSIISRFFLDAKPKTYLYPRSDEKQE